MLFKAGDRATGKDWAEVVACHLCERIGLPHVDYELAAEYEGENRIRQGVVKRGFTVSIVAQMPTEGKLRTDSPQPIAANGEAPDKDLRKWIESLPARKHDDEAHGETVAVPQAVRFAQPESH